MKAKTPARAEQPANSRPTHDQIAQRAYEIFLEHGATHGQDVENWLRAERELQATKGSKQKGRRAAAGARARR